MLGSGPAAYRHCAAGPAVKYKPAVLTRRKVWVSVLFQSEFPQLWLALLEVLAIITGPWVILHGAEQWAQTKAIATEARRPAGVLALVTPAEAAEFGMDRLHVLGPKHFLKIVCRRDEHRTSLGLGCL